MAAMNSNSWPPATPFDRLSAAAVSQSPVQLHRGSPGTPTSHSAERDGGSSLKRKRSSGGSRGTGTENGEGSPGRGGRHQPGVKRACNDCRQQKLRCNVTAGPGETYKACDRCIKHKLHCSIDNDFKRLGKRAAHDEMVRELDAVKARLAEYEALGIALPSDADQGTSATAFGGEYSSSPSGGVGRQPFLGPSEAAASRSLLDLSQGYRELPPTSYPSITPGASPKTLRHVTLSDEQLQELYAIYFQSFHPFLPVLNPEWNYNQYYSLHPLLHWTIVAVAARRYDPKPGLLVEIQQPLEEMVWTTLSQVPQIYHVCKALALLCTWPLPNSSTTTEPTMMLTGAMFQLAMQYGLHRPSHAQDFSRFRVDLREEDIADRLNTWAAVNIVAQMVSTGQGQPPLSRWAWYTYGLHLDRMKSELHTRCQIEKFVDTVTRTLFTMQRDHIVEVDQAQRGLQIDMYARELNEMELTIMSTRSSSIETLYLKCAALHLRLSAFFDKPSAPTYLTDLRGVYIAASSLLTVVSGLSPAVAQYMPRYIEQMLLAGAVTLLKLLNSFYSRHVDVAEGKRLFGRTVAVLRGLSVRSNDLPQRLAEVMAQLWTTSEQKQQASISFLEAAETKPPIDESLQLRVRCRSSLSVLYDAIWRWRQQVGPQGRDDLDTAVEHPTAIAASELALNNTNHHNISRRVTPQPPGVSGVGMESDVGMGPLDWDAFGGNAVFDPLSWALDGNLQFGGPLFGGDGLGGFSV